MEVIRVRATRSLFATRLSHRCNRSHMNARWKRAAPTVIGAAPSRAWC